MTWEEELDRRAVIRLLINLKHVNTFFKMTIMVIGINLIL